MSEYIVGSVGHVLVGHVGYMLHNILAIVGHVLVYVEHLL